MAAITTTGTNNGPVSTDHLGGEPTSDWVTRHNGGVAAATPAGNNLTTTWKSANGDQTKSTPRKPGESNGAFLARHMLEYVTAMVEEPPV